MMKGESSKRDEEKIIVRKGHPEKTKGGRTRL